VGASDTIGTPEDADVTIPLADATAIMRKAFIKEFIVEGVKECCHVLSLCHAQELSLLPTVYVEFRKIISFVSNIVFY
jgi:hypothetical protein